MTVRTSSRVKHHRGTAPDALARTMIRPSTAAAARAQGRFWVDAARLRSRPARSGSGDLGRAISAGWRLSWNRMKRDPAHEAFSVRRLQ